MRLTMNQKIAGTVNTLTVWVTNCMGTINTLTVPIQYTFYPPLSPQAFARIVVFFMFIAYRLKSASTVF